jgi:hypothetical protein
MDGQFLMIMAGIFLILSKISFYNGDKTLAVFYVAAGMINAVFGAILLWK